MKKKGFVVLAVAAVLALGTATMSAWAAEGWAQSGNTWSYYDSNGYKVTNVWKKGADNLWRYLNGNGEMAVNTWVDNTYYMDSNGILVTDKWMKFQERLWTTGPRLIINGIILILTVRCRPDGFWITCTTVVRME